MKAFIIGVSGPDTTTVEQIRALLPGQMQFGDKGELVLNLNVVFEVPTGYGVALVEGLVQAQSPAPALTSDPSPTPQ